MRSTLLKDMTKEDSITLILPSPVCIAGQVFQGQVKFYFPTLQSEEVEEVHVKLRGSVIVKFDKNHHGRSSDWEGQELVKQNVSIWSRGQVYPPSGSHTLIIPFEFQLPSYLPPSCHFENNKHCGMVGYVVEVVGVRSGMFKLNRRLTRPISLVPPDPIGAQIRHVLQMGDWGGSWTMVKKQDNIRRGLWGPLSHVMMEFQYPSMKAFPLNTKIPFIIRVVTRSKPMKRDECECRIDTTSLGGLGSSGPKETSPQIDVMDKLWVPDEYDKSMGHWVQESIIQSSFMLRCSPTFRITLISISYSMYVRVGFPGIGNDLSEDIPIQIGSGVLMPPNPYRVQPADAPPYEGPPPPLDLPPSYWSGADFASDEKK
ncbi:Arrestin domain-containing protein [Abortiporus biennis]